MTEASKPVIISNPISPNGDGPASLSSRRSSGTSATTMALQRVEPAGKTHD